MWSSITCKGSICCNKQKYSHVYLSQVRSYRDDNEYKNHFSIFLFFVHILQNAVHEDALVALRHLPKWYFSDDGIQMIITLDAPVPLVWIRAT